MGLSTGRPWGPWREPSSPLHRPRTVDPAGSRQLFPGPEQRGGSLFLSEEELSKSIQGPTVAPSKVTHAALRSPG